MTPELILVLGKGIIWWLIPLGFCCYQLWTVRRRGD